VEKELKAGAQANQVQFNSIAETMQAMQKTLEATQRTLKDFATASTAGAAQGAAAVWGEEKAAGVAKGGGKGGGKGKPWQRRRPACYICGSLEHLMNGYPKWAEMSPAKEAQLISALGHYESGGSSELSASAVAERFSGSTDAGAEA
jgi:hypothetical protein